MDVGSYFSFFFWNFVLSVSSSFYCCFLISKGQVFLGKPDTEVVCLSSDSEKEDDGIPEEDIEMLESWDRKGWDEIKGDRIHLVAGVEDNKMELRETAKVSG